MTQGKRVAIVQSNYIPWKGYFDMIAAVDEFILFDDMQYTRRDWRNRNKIKTPNGLQWLTVPVQAKGNFYQKIRYIELDGNTWAKEHWQSLLQNYRRAKHFDMFAPELESLYLEQKYTHLSQLNRTFIEWVCSKLGITTTISNSWDYNPVEGRTERLAGLCAQAGGAEYISGPSAKDYVDESIFTNANIKLTWFDYNGYPEYPQLWGTFEHGVTILDLLFNCGSDAGQFMKHLRNQNK